MAFDVAAAKKYAEQLATDLGLDGDAKTNFLATLASDKAAEHISKAFMPTEDFKRESGRVAKKEKDLQDWYSSQVKVAEDNQKAVQQAQADVQAYINAFGTLPDGSTPRGTVVQAAADYVDKKSVEKMLSDRDAQFLSITKTGMWAVGDYFKRFGEALDPDQLEEFAVKNNLPLKLAYEKMIEPKLTALNSASVEERVKLAREEGLKEGLSKSGIPVDSAPKEQSPWKVWSARPKETATKPSEAFTQAWNEASASK